MSLHDCGYIDKKSCSAIDFSRWNFLDLFLYTDHDYTLFASSVKLAVAHRHSVAILCKNANFTKIFFAILPFSCSVVGSHTRVVKVNKKSIILVEGIQIFAAFNNPS